jgi:hypothetical protein
VAEFLAPAVADARKADPTMDCYIVHSADRKRHFGHVISLAHGETVVVPRGHIAFFASIALELGNLDLYSQVAAHMPTVCSPYAIARQFEIGFQGGISHLAAKFSDYSPPFFHKFTIDILYSIFANPSFVCSNEDLVLECIVSGFTDNPEYFSLFEFVHFEYLLPDSILTLFDSISYLSLSLPIWRNVVRALRSRIVPPHTIISIPFSNVPLNGIIAHLTRTTDFSEALRITGHEPVNAGASWAAANAADLENMSVFCSIAAPDQWLCYDFGNRLIIPTHYTLRGGNGSWAGRLTKWVLEGAMDEEWTQLDWRAEFTTVGPEPIVFQVAQPAACRRVRIRQIEFHPLTNNNIVLAAFELFGDLEENRPSCKGQ